MNHSIELIVKALTILQSVTSWAKWWFESGHRLSAGKWQWCDCGDSGAMAVCDENKHWWRTPVEAESVSLQPWRDPVLLKHWGMSFFCVFFILDVYPSPARFRSGQSSDSRPVRACDGWEVVRRFFREGSGTESAGAGGQREGKAHCSQGAASRNLSTPSWTSLVLRSLLLACCEGDWMKMSCFSPQPSPRSPKDSVFFSSPPDPSSA